MVRTALSAAAAGALLFAARGPVRAEDPSTPRPAPALSVRASPEAGKPGALLFLTIRSSRPLASLRLTGAGGIARLEPDAARRVFRGLLGIDLDRAPGRLTLTFDGKERDGGAFSTPWTVRVAPAKFPVERLRVDPAQVEPPADALPRIEAERERVAAVWKAPDEPRRWTSAFELPVAGVSGGNFGVRRIYNGKERSRHNGVDYPAASGTPVTAPAPGRVALAEELYFSGGTVILDHGDGLFTSYFHLSRIDVAAGDLVETGARLGAVGATGRVTGPHLHWSARLEGARIDPRFLRNLAAWPLPGQKSAPAP